MLKEFNNDVLKVIRQKIQEQLSINGVTVKVGNCTYEKEHCKFNLELSIEGAKSKEEIDLETFAELHNLNTNKENTLGVGRKKYKLIGYRRKARAKPYIIADILTNAKFVITTEQAQRFFSRGILVEEGA